jgi:hypothetical protein
MIERPNLSSTTSSIWPNEPAGYTLVTDQSWDSLTSDSWVVAWNDSGYVSIEQDASAPLSPTAVAQFHWPIGETDGHGVGAPMHALGASGSHRVYVGLWWRPSNPWQGDSSSVNKIQYLQTDAVGSIFMAMYGPPGGPYQIRVFPQFTTSQDRWLVPNVNSVNITLGQWHRLEWLVDYSGLLGHIQWWVDGVLVGDYSDDPPPLGPLTAYQLNPVWGGNGGDRKTEDDYYWFDHTYISIN